eukprot:EG_transcript_18867
MAGSGACPSPAPAEATPERLPVPTSDGPGTPVLVQSPLATPADPAFSSARRPAHVFPFSLLQAATVVEPRDLTSASPAGQLGTPQADGDLSAQLALAALEADLSKARDALRGCALPSPADPFPSAEPEAPHPLLDLLRALNVPSY